MAGNTVTRFSRRACGIWSIGAMGGVILATIGQTSEQALAAAYDPSLEGAAIECYDGTYWCLTAGYRHGVPDEPTWYAINSANGQSAYAWSESAVYSIPEAQAVPSRIPTGNRAADWAAKQNGSLSWGSGADTWCLMFVANAYGEPSAGYDTAYDCWSAIGRPGSVPVANELPRGEILFFDKNAGNEYSGHCGIFIGNGQYASVGSQGVVVKSALDSSTNFAPYLGHAAAPITWPGLQAP